MLWLPGRLGAHQREGELGGGASESPPSSAGASLQPSPAENGERECRVCVVNVAAVFLRPRLCLDLRSPPGIIP